MRRVLTAEQMREADRRTIDEIGVPGLLLMENAASRVVEELTLHGSLSEFDRVLVVCGKGSNGGDGLAIARLLRVRNLARDLTVVLAADPEGLSGDAAANWRMLRGVGVEPVAVTDFAAWEKLRTRTLRATLIVDALLGTGLSGPARGLAAELIEDLNEHYGHATTIAVDMPSGLASDGGPIEGAVMRADTTVTFTSPKPGQVLEPGAERVGMLRVRGIGTPDRLIESIEGDRLYVTEESDFRDLFAPRQADAHKGTFGHVALVGGSRATPGAVAMSGTAALRAGAGLVTVFTAASGAPAVVATTPELMTLPLQETGAGTIDAEAFDPRKLDAMDVLAVGPGLGEDGGELTRRLLETFPRPAVVDADGLRAFAGANPRSRPKTLILTPHPGEMARMTGLSTAQVQADRVGVARRFAVEREAILVLKGARTLVACPDGRVLVNPVSEPGMATAGSGDVLTGLTAGLLAQFPDLPAERVVCAAVRLHSLAGVIASGRRSQQSMLATDLFDALPKAIRRMR